MKGLEQERLAERTTMGAALDEMLVGQLDEQGLQLEEALAAAEAAAEAEAAALRRRAARLLQSSRGAIMRA